MYCLMISEGVQINPETIYKSKWWNGRIYLGNTSGEHVKLEARNDRGLLIHSNIEKVPFAVFVRGKKE